MIRCSYVIIISILFLNANGQSSFREDQLKFARVSNAYEEKWAGIDTLLSQKGIEREMLEVYFRDFKDKTDLWEDLKAGYDHFEKYKNLPKVTFLGNGRHVISE